MKILILGGYGVFGGRLAELLSDLGELELLICGRSLSRATDFCATYTGKARVRPLALDRLYIADGLKHEMPDLVVDASGPFQNYAADPYRVITACIGAKINYLDFADAADFVFGVSRFDAEARAAGTFVLSGVSSFPALTAAVLREMAKTMDILSVKGGIAPSPHAGIGLNVMRAVIGYAGAPVKLWRDGRPANAIGLAESLRFTVAVPGRLPLRNIRFSLVDVPDLQVIPPKHPTMTDIWMGAGPAPEILLRILNLVAKARAALRFPSLAPLSGLFHQVVNTLRFGEHRGGMFVTARGIVAGQIRQQSWHLLAEGDDGPYIPSMAAAAIILKILKDEMPEPGARSAVRALEITDYDALFAGRTIYTGFRQDEQGSDAPLYRKILGESFRMLPPRVQELHDTKDLRRWRGTADVRRGRGLLSKLAALMVGFPAAGRNIPVEVLFQPEQTSERWTRTFGGKTFSSVQSPGSGKDEYLLVERFGVASISLALVINEGKLHLIPRRLTILGIPMPRFLLPKGTTFETEDQNSFCFDVEISVPFVGLLVAYKGKLHPAPPA